MSKLFNCNYQTSEKSDNNYENMLISEPSTFNLDIIWTDEFGITLKSTSSILFENVLSICRSEILFQVDYIFDLMSRYFPILNKIEDKSEIKKAISRTIIEMAKAYNTENRSIVEHLKFVYNDDTVYINIRI